MTNVLDGIEQDGTVLDENTELTALIEKEETPQDSSPETPAEETAGEAAKQTQETPPESSTEEPKADEQPKQVPFHEDPTIQEYITRQVDKRLEEGTPKIEQSIAEKLAPREQETVPTWFGGDLTAWKQYQAHETQRFNEAVDTATKRIKTEQETEAKRVQEANEWFESNLREIESSGLKVDRNKLLKTAQDYQLVDTQGRWNYKAAAAILRTSEPKIDTTDKKQLAAATTQSGKTEEKPRDYLTPDDLKGKGWHDFNP